VGLKSLLMYLVQLAIIAFFYLLIPLLAKVYKKNHITFYERMKNYAILIILGLLVLMCAAWLWIGFWMIGYFMMIYWHNETGFIRAIIFFTAPFAALYISFTFIYNKIEARFNRALT